MRGPLLNRIWLETLFQRFHRLAIPGAGGKVSRAGQRIRRSVEQFIEEAILLAGRGSPAITFWAPSPSHPPVHALLNTCDIGLGFPQLPSSFAQLILFPGALCHKMWS